MVDSPELLEEFLVWFRETTEAKWQVHQPRTLEDQKQYGVGGSDWRTGTKWSPGLTDVEIANLEKTEGRPFPEDYRLFLAILGGLDRKQISFRFEGSELVQREFSPFPDWHDLEDISSRRADFLEGILFDVENGVWLRAWGEEPDSVSGKIRIVKSLFEDAPPLLPICYHRAMPSVQTVKALPVLSIHQTDAIAIASSMEQVLLYDFGDLIGMTYPEEFNAPVELPEEYGFWRDLVLST